MKIQYRDEMTIYLDKIDGKLSLNRIVLGGEPINNFKKFDKIVFIKSKEKDLVKTKECMYKYKSKPEPKTCDKVVIISKEEITRKPMKCKEYHWIKEVESIDFEDDNNNKVIDEFVYVYICLY